jgi:SAM-dependent methyltransferase
MKLNEKNSEKTIDLYTERYTEYGYSPKTLGWFKGKQNMRFDVLTSQVDLENNSILDIGCGFGDLNLFLDKKLKKYNYFGIDIVPVLIDEAKERYKNNNSINFQCGEFLKEDIKQEFDYAIGSGIFNFKLENQDNYEYIEGVIQKAFSICRIVVDFYFLSDKVDFIKYNHTFHSAPDKILKMGYKFSKNIILRNDYAPFEFSMFLFIHEKCKLNLE